MSSFPHNVVRFVAAALLTSVPTALAIDVQLSEEEIRQALQEGRNLVSRQQGYPVSDWVLWDDDDPFTLQEGEGQVEAVVVGTPYERLRYQSYLQAYQGKELTEQEAREEVRGLENTVTFVVFAHSQGTSQEYRDFLKEFSSARLEVEGGPTLEPTEITTFGPAQDFYTIPGKAAEFRYLGTVAYRFDLSSLAQQREVSDLAGTLTFTAPSGQAHRYEVNLGDYR